MQHLDFFSLDGDEDGKASSVIFTLGYFYTSKKALSLQVLSLTVRSSSSRSKYSSCLQGVSGAQTRPACPSGFPELRAALLPSRGQDAPQHALAWCPLGPTEAGMEAPE